MTSIQEFRDLWASVLMQAMKDLTDKKELIRQSAKHWLTDNKNEDFNSFKGICYFLDLPSRKALRLILKQNVYEGET